MPFAQFEIHESLQGGWTRLTLLGELDIATAPKLEARLSEHRAEGRSVLMDLSRLDFMDSAGLGVVTRALRSSWDDVWAFVVDPNLAPQVRTLFRLTTLDQFVGINNADAMSA